MRAKNQLRIVSGYLSGQLIDTPKTSATKPMGERERIAIFNQIRSHLPEARVLDAFAGSGALGITAISNGANSVDFLEKNPEAIKTISANLKKHKCNEKAKIVKNIDEAIKRVKTIAAPQNTIRLGIETPCGKTGECVSLRKENPELCDGCHGDTRICCNYVVSAQQRHIDRIKVIIIGEEYGY